MSKETSLAYERIDALDLSFLLDELQDKERGAGWTEEKVQDAIANYKLFLKLRATHPKVELVPTATIDEVWHSHILHTERYIEDCKAIFGKYIHHRPSFKKDPAELAEFKKKFKETQRLMFEAFGEPFEEKSAGFCLDPSPSCCCYEPRNA
jgi:hypothetical protein